MPLKQGDTFVSTIVFDEQEWTDKYSGGTFTAQAANGADRRTLTVTTNATARTITLTAAMTGWPLGIWSWDVKCVRSGVTRHIPASINAQFGLVAGVTE